MLYWYLLIGILLGILAISKFGAKIKVLKPFKVLKKDDAVSKIGNIVISAIFWILLLIWGIYLVIKK